MVSGDDVSVESAVMAFGLSPCVIHAGPDGRELDRSTHHLPWPVFEAAEEIENHTPIALLVFETCALLVVAGIEITVVDAIFPEIGGSFARMTCGGVILLNDFLHSVTEPARQ